LGARRPLVTLKGSTLYTAGKTKLFFVMFAHPGHQLILILFVFNMPRVSIKKHDTKSEANIMQVK